MSRIGRFVGDLFPTTRRNRELLTRFHGWDENSPSKEDDADTAETVAAETCAGRVLGFRDTSGRNDGGPFAAAPEPPLIFRGVPFAEAGRLEPPRRVGPRADDLDCRRLGPACPQPPTGMRFLYEHPIAMGVETFLPPLPADKSHWYGVFDEDKCLNANVFTPDLDGEEKRPVLVFIHGGAFAMGSNTEGGMYDASSLASRHNVVVVTINYRIGPFGFLHFPQEGITNLGLRDQIAGLEWVRDNVANFGGDPDSVTIAGESAGGMSVATLAASPRAKGLFSRAIAMSGASNFQHSARQWGHFFPAIEKGLKSELDGGALTAESLKKVPAHRLADYVGRTMFKPVAAQLGNSTMDWQPIRDGDVVPMDGAHSALASAPPILTGVLENEWALFAQMLPTPRTREKVMGEAVNVLRGYFHWTKIDDGPGDEEKWKRQAATFYELLASCRLEQGLPVEPKDIMGAMHNLVTFEEPNFCLARDAGAFSYNLHFDDNGHARDLPLLFDFSAVAGTKASPSLGQPSEKEWHRAAQFQEALVSFARRGVPRVDGAEWKAFPETMHLSDEQPEMRPFKRELVEFQSLKKDIVANLDIDTVLAQNIE